MKMVIRRISIAAFGVTIASACGDTDRRSWPDAPVDAGDGDAPEAVECPGGDGWMCGEDCVDLMSDPDHCGACGFACAADEVCDLGRCVAGCSQGLAACDRSCVDLARDLDHCGRCGNACVEAFDADPVCERSVCGLACRDGHWDLDGEPGCEYACVPRGDETCNGADDDCDGVTDDGFPCAPGESTECTTTCGSSGTGPCDADCTPPDASGCTPPVEACNGADDDCDGACDNGFTCCAGDTTPCVTECRTIGERACGDDCTWGPDCSTGTEACNGLDDDCDTLCDEEFECCRRDLESCTTVCGTTGNRSCSDTCEWSPCAPPREMCNGLDDDCDDVCDNGFVCCAGDTRPCDTVCGTGTGVQTCMSGCAWGSCVAPEETCNGLDDDCDTACDNGFRCCMGVIETCNNTCGVAGTRPCGATCTLGPCCALDEVCNNACDDDCDGTTNEDCDRGDVCADPLVIPPGATSVTDDTSRAANDYDTSCPGGPGPDLVYRYVPSASGTVTFHTCGGASFDTVLYARTTCDDASTEVACNDDSCGLQSWISFAVTAGTTYYVFVDGYGSWSMGAFTLTITGP